MVTQSNRLDEASSRELVRRFGSGLKSSDFSPNAQVRASQRDAATRAPNTPEGTNSSESCIAPGAENPGLDHCTDSKHACSTGSSKSEDNPVNEIDFAELKDGTLVELVEDSTNPRRTCLAVWKNGQVLLTERLEQDGHTFVPLARKDEVLGRLRLPSSVMPYGSLQELLSRLESFISRCVAVDEKFVPVLADFVLSTWFVDRLSVAPYLSVVGLPQSGKTTLLKALSLVCRSSLLISDITSASFYRVCARFSPTMLIDETATVANDRTLRHILRTGTNRDVVTVRRNHAFHSYGAKVLSWLEPPNDAALNSRCILIPMFESKSTALARIEEPEVQRLAAELRGQLLQFRFENYKRVQSSPIPGEEVLRPRTRDLLRALAAAHADGERSQSLLQFFASGQGVPAEPLDAAQNAVLRALFSIVHRHEGFVSICVKDLTQQVNGFLELEGERLRLQPRKVGAVLTSLGFSSRTRTNSGWTMFLSLSDVEKIHQLAASYGVDRAGRSFRRISPDKCTLCRAAGLDNKAPALPPEVTSRVEVDPREELKTQLRSLIREPHGSR